MIVATEQLVELLMVFTHKKNKLLNEDKDAIMINHLVKASASLTEASKLAISVLFLVPSISK